MTEQSSKTEGAGDEVVLRRDGAIAEIVLNRPEAANGLTLSLLKSLCAAIMDCHGDSSIRVVILRGAGKHFCAGGDVKDFAAKGDALPAYLRQATSYLQVAAGGLMRLNAPVIASVQGFGAGGGGLGLVCASDFVVAAQSASFMAAASRAGMAPDAGLSVTLSRLVGLRKAMDIVLRNPVISAEEALGIGLITMVAPDGQLAARTMELASELCAGAPLALAASKRLLWAGLGRGVDAAFPEESTTVSDLSGTADAREALAAVIARRPPRFEGR